MSGEEVDPADLAGHIGRLVALYAGDQWQGPWFEVLDVGPVVDGVCQVTVPGRPDKPLGRPVQIGALAGVLYPLRDAPAPGERPALLRAGHYVRHPDDIERPPRKPRPRAGAGRSELAWKKRERDREAELARWPGLASRNAAGVAEGVRELVRTGVVQQGKRLPTAPEIARVWGVDVSVVRAAIKVLTKEQVIRYVRGRGHFVREVAREQT